MTTIRDPFDFRGCTLLINSHTARYRPMRQIRHLHHVWLFLFTFHLPFCNVRLESFSKIDRAHDGVDDCNDDQEDGDDSESR